VLEAGNNAFEWVWDGLPPAERIIFSAIAEGTEEGQVLDKDQIVQVLQGHGIRILIRELDLAPQTLVDWLMLARVNGGYRFFIELMRRWVARNKPLARVRDELDRVDEVADGYFKLGKTFYRQEKRREAIEELRKAVITNPNHLNARLLLGTCLREEGDLIEAIKELEWAYEYDPQASRYELVLSLLFQGERVEAEGDQDAAVAVYDRILEVSPRGRLARERRATIYERQGDEALEAGDYESALSAFQEAGATEKHQEAVARQRRQTLDAEARRATVAMTAESWGEAIEIYSRLAAEDPEDDRWAAALRQAEQERELELRYSEALGAIEQKQWKQAQRILADLVYERPDYRQASRYLHQAVSGKDTAKLEASLEAEKKARAERELQLAAMDVKVSSVQRRLDEAAVFPFRHLSAWGWISMGALAVALLGIGVLIGALLIRQPVEVVAPQVTIEFPPNNAVLAVNEEVEILIRAQAATGVSRVELQIDSGEPITLTPPAGESPTTFSVSHRWKPEELKDYNLTATVYDAEGKASEPVVHVVQVSEPTPVPTDTPPVGQPAVEPSNPATGTLWTQFDGRAMVYVPAGTFKMGSLPDDSDAADDEKPQHEVYLDAFWIDRTEVTNIQYLRCVEAGICSPPSDIDSSHRNVYWGDAAYDDYPVISVSWRQAADYCQWAGGRLPTEAEWEKAARGTDGRTYPWGEDLSCSLANYGDCTVGDTVAVASFPAGLSPYGAFDMAGNVQEWVADWYDEMYYEASPGKNPQGPSDGADRVVRGGDYSVDGILLRVVYRGGQNPSNGDRETGLRCAGNPSQ